MCQVPSDSKGLSFLQEDSVTNGAKEAKATADEFLTEAGGWGGHGRMPSQVLPMAAPNLPMPEVGPKKKCFDEKQWVAVEH